MQHTPYLRIRETIRRALAAIRKKLGKSSDRPDLPQDPYAYVTAPKRPRPSNRGAAAIAELPEDELQQQ